ncbi:MAG TPA: hypothetical protein ENJ84_09715 [Gammaproteobacteria bacterium]|nr:hypothetical protein [Gammaproteobacteria bacterium]
MTSQDCERVSLILSLIYKFTAFAGLIAILVTKDVYISALFMVSAMALFSLTRYLQPLICGPEASSQNTHQVPGRQEISELPADLQSEYRALLKNKDAA